MKKRVVSVKVEKMAERYCGNLTGSVVYHTTERGCSSGLFKGCPLGRGYTEEQSLADFVFRANSDDSTLKLKTKELNIVERRDYTK